MPREKFNSKIVNLNHYFAFIKLSHYAHDFCTTLYKQIEIIYSPFILKPNFDS